MPKFLIILIWLFALYNANAKEYILNGTGPYNKLANKECIYAVSYLKDHAFVTTKCSVTDETLNLLKNWWL